MYVNTLSSTEKKKKSFISIHIFIDMVWDITYVNSYNAVFSTPSCPTTHKRKNEYQNYGSSQMHMHVINLLFLENRKSIT